MAGSAPNRVQAYDKESFARIDATSVEYVKELVRRVERALAAGDGKEFGIIGRELNGRGGKHLAFLRQLIVNCRKLHGDNVLRVSAEDAAAAEAAKLAAEAEQHAIAEKETRRKRYEELKALEAEFGK